MLSAADALKRLKAGNARFVSGVRHVAAPLDQTARAGLVSAQRPFATILSCSDSRVPPELIFDAGLGELFVIRVAGNVLAPHQLGSVEFAVDALGTRLIVVLGHSGCGAVDATLQVMQAEDADLSPNLGALVAEIRPALAPLLAETDDPAELLARGVGANVARSVAGLTGRSELLAQKVLAGELMIMGAEYRLEDGEVNW